MPGGPTPCGPAHVRPTARPLSTPPPGVFVLSLVAAAEERHLLSAALFAALLNLKHIFLYAAPAYFVFLLRRYCRWAGNAGSHNVGLPSLQAPERLQLLTLWRPPSRLRPWPNLACRGPRAVPRFLALSLIVGGTFALSFGPFVAAGQLAQLTTRLFPFARGLCHAYWAPNAWALYAVADKALSALLGKRGAAASMTGGLVGAAEFAVLPQVGSAATALWTLAAMSPCLLRTW